ncbi:MAG: type II secretion system protein GspK [Candidatus Didemnitutus sp.]|nr:type II secretion system protein GspK [Candidatus Didemnitutus sp.]
MHARSTQLSRNRGAVIVLVLVTVLLASFLLAAFLRRSGTELLADARAGEQRRLRAEAYSALETTLAILADFRAAEGALRSPVEPWGEALAVSGYVPEDGREVAVTFADESGKLSLPTASEAELQTMMEFAGIERNEAERMATVLHAWMRKTDEHAVPDFNAPDYSHSEPAYRPAGRPLRSWGELAAAELERHLFFDEDGRMTPEGEAFVRETSLFSFPRVNLNSANSGVLTALGMGAGSVTALEQHRTRPRTTGDLGVFRSLTEAGTALGAAELPERAGTNIEVLRINVAVSQGSVVYRLSVVITPGSGTAPRARGATETENTGAVTAPPPERKMLNYPFAVLEIREDAPPFTPLPTTPDA